LELVELVDGLHPQLQVSMLLAAAVVEEEMILYLLDPVDPVS
jgi:hypothetical protein